MKYSTIVIFLIFLFCSCQSIREEKRDYIVWQWNQTGKNMPQYINDSLSLFFSRYHREGIPFTLWGKGLSDEKDSIDGVYQYRLFVTHQPIRLLIIYKSKVYIMRNVKASGMLTELCGFITKYNPERSFVQKVLKEMFNLLLDEYVDVQEMGGKEMPPTSRKEIIDYLWAKSRKDEVANIAKVIKERIDVGNGFSDYVLNKNHTEEEIIIAIGIIANVLDENHFLIKDTY